MAKPPRSRSAALTGHLVLSTLHTNDAAGAVARILDMGAEPYLVASSLIGSVAQRLVRLNCPACKRQEEPDPDAIREVGLSAEERAHAAFMRGAKCEECGFTGYRGRAGVFELLTVDDEVRRMITQRASAIEIKRHALANQGMRTLIADGRDKVVRGLTPSTRCSVSASATAVVGSNREPRAKMGKMVGYRYIAVDSAGREVRGHVEAPDASEALSRVRELGHLPVEVQAVARKEAAGGRGAGAQGRSGRITRSEVTAFTRQLSDLTGAGLPIDRALSVLIEQSDNAALASMLVEVQREIRGGRSLSETLAAYPRHFSPMYTNMLRAGEMSGQLPEVATRLAEFLEREQERRSQIVSAMVYPLLLLGVAVLSVVFLLAFVVPRLSGVFDDLGADMPLPTVVLLATTGLIGRYWWILLGGLAGAWVFGKGFAATEAGRRQIDALALRLPVVGRITTRVVISRFARALGTLLGGGAHPRRA